MLAALVETELDTLIDVDAWDAEIEREERARRELKAISDDYDNIAAKLTLDDDGAA